MKVFLRNAVVAAITMVIVSNSLYAMAVFGEHDRSSLSDQAIKKKMVKIYYEGNYICNGFASAKNQITTAAKCIDINDLHEYSLRIVGESEERSIDKARVNPRSGVAVLKVNKINDFFEMSEFIDNKETVLISCDHGIDDCSRSKEGGLFETPFAGMMFHTYDSTKGAAGAPFLQEGKVVAIHQGVIAFKRVNSRAEDETITYNFATKAREKESMYLDRVSISYDL
ncbi:MAG: hypothetical protein HQK50_01310 [Oligoflexia bacterium]|nr:hypothetical protein [Oligoflexia bacterium]MBF0364176.1 hypothetical protein [Oligoflexia bacterium]